MEEKIIRGSSTSSTNTSSTSLDEHPIRQSNRIDGVDVVVLTTKAGTRRQWIAGITGNYFCV